MENIKEEFLKKITSMIDNPSADNVAYGGKVMPILKMYKGLKSFEERKAFQDALEEMLSSKEDRVRSFAVDVCLGFFVFRDAIR